MVQEVVIHVTMPSPFIYLFLCCFVFLLKNDKLIIGPLEVDVENLGKKWLNWCWVGRIIFCMYKGYVHSSSVRTKDKEEWISTEAVWWVDVDWVSIWSDRSFWWDHTIKLSLSIHLWLETIMFTLTCGMIAVVSYCVLNETVIPQSQIAWVKVFSNFFFLVEQISFKG